MRHSLSHADLHSASHFEYNHRSERGVCNSNRELYQDSFLLFSLAASFLCSFVSLADQSLRSMPYISYTCSISTKIWNRFFILKWSIFYVMIHLLVYVSVLRGLQTLGVGGGGVTVAVLFERPENSHTCAVRHPTLGLSHYYCDKYNVNCLYRCTVQFVVSLNQHTNWCTYMKFHIKTLKIATTCFGPKIIFRELHCSLLKSHF